MTVGLKDLVFAPITLGADGVPSYGKVSKLAEVMNADLSVTTAEGTLYADDAVSESVKEFVKGALKLGIKDLAPKHVATLLGQKMDADQVIYGGADDEPPYVAVGFRAKKTGGVYRYIWLYRVKFKIPNEKFQTKGEAIVFNTPEIEGEFFTRYDGRWKADYTGAETGAVGKNFLSEVREYKEEATEDTTGSGTTGDDNTGEDGTEG